MRFHYLTKNGTSSYALLTLELEGRGSMDSGTITPDPLGLRLRTGDAGSM
jgi:hypothetical protein